MRYLPLIVLGVLLNAIAQLLLKEGMRRIGYFAFDWANVVPIGLRIAVNPFVLGGLILYVVSFVVWLLVLSRVAVSFAYPMLSLGYIFNAVAAYYLFSENVTLTRFAGICVIVLGTYLITRT
ncbi:MAG: 4-amino-4-deoxy-L-arabinose transferase [Gammaproteobacteria bacterium]|nr:4-amino-4-deoxy-L-arabinose transferase [Gammaproteobacteria bacterium]